MTRTITTRRDLTAALHRSPGVGMAPEPTSRPDDYKLRLFKYIPAEVVALYLTLEALLRAANESAGFLPWAIFGFCFLATPFYLWRVAGVGRWPQLLISTVAFAVWIFALGGPFAVFTWYKPIYGGILLPAYTFLIPIFAPGKGSSGEAADREAA